ncbi:N-terminal Xaa-Pro-Lys N-methyltransferase 1-like [Branchiostoma lanceolatum]|uniref:N-terminal Xaa-Pro-Lys N-methyltransferase 1-like n=1 Tax=Branchiostoma lanceolatum TaxID=7740 RepID=UPI0034532C5F
MSSMDNYPDTQFYGDAESYWKEIPATVDGMLGGYSKVDKVDIKGSKKFLQEFISGPNAKTKTRRAVDCGAGIGRVSHGLLCPLFSRVDLVEVCQKFLDQAKTDLGSSAKKVDRYICCGLQDFTPDPGRYDVIWVQWVLGHLTHKDLVAFFQRCRAGLAENGIVVVKENVADDSCSDGVIFDQSDSSVTRSHRYLKQIIEESGMRIVKEEAQKDLPKELFKVQMMVLQ